MNEIDLDTSLERVFRLTDVQKRGLKKLSMASLGDLVHHVPSRYTSSASIKPIASAAEGERVTLEGKISKLDFEKTWKKRLNIARGELSDNTGKIRLVWFHQPYIAKMLKEDDLVRVIGKVGSKSGQLFISNPVYEKISRLSFHGGVNVLLATYPETRGISSRWLGFHIRKAFDLLGENIRDPLPTEIIQKYHLPSLRQACRAVHFPKSEGEIEAARKRLAFEEIFLIQISRMQERLRLEEKTSLTIPSKGETKNEFLEKLPFELTKTQDEIFETILKDIARKTPMARLLEGDVGSGKTVIAAGASYAAAQAGFQVAYMAPTEILARQHFESFSKYLGRGGFKIGLLTSSEARVYPSKAFRGESAHIPKTQLIRWLVSGEVKILIGTHALLGKSIRFKNLAFIIVDEQHRFGIAQRSALAKSKSHSHDFVPHFLSMTATPIPRTLALTIFGDLDLSVLDELPPGRASITTMALTKPARRNWELIRQELAKGRQAFVVCPRIENNEERSEQKSVRETYKKLSSEVFPEFRSSMLHGKMTPREKDRTMKEFREGKIKLLVATNLI
ncbi:MAG: DEAD/DEAH box helicase, partial [Candidatus Ryanbacteria bacterium]|nr:DEAD/DEAH box helicase [Candidatus Ryanbacteria bacterium]